MSLYEIGFNLSFKCGTFLPEYVFNLHVCYFYPQPQLLLIFHDVLSHEIVLVLLIFPGASFCS